MRSSSENYKLSTVVLHGLFDCQWHTIVAMFTVSSVINKFRDLTRSCFNLSGLVRDHGQTTDYIVESD